MSSPIAIFVQNEYRYFTTAEETAVKANYTKARLYERNTNLNTIEGTTALANEILLEEKNAKRSFVTVLENTHNIANLSSFDGSPPVFTIKSESLATPVAGIDSLPTVVEVDYSTNRTTIYSRGY